MASRPSAEDYLLGTAALAAIFGAGLAMWGLIALAAVAAVSTPWATAAGVVVIAGFGWLTHRHAIRRPFLLAACSVWAGAWLALVMEAM